MLSITETAYYTASRIRRNNLAPKTNTIVNTMGNILLSLQSVQSIEVCSVTPNGSNYFLNPKGAAPIDFSEEI